MFATICGASLLENDLGLRRFVRKRDEQALPDRYGVFISYVLAGGIFRRSDISVRGSFCGAASIHFAELVYPPFAYVLAVDSGPPDERLVEIGQPFSSYRFKEKAAINLPLPQLPTPTSIPGDYRTAREVEARLVDQGIDPGSYRSPFGL